MSPAFQPGGSFQSSEVGRPVPGCTQYVCQCGSCTKRIATVRAWPGWTEASAATSEACTCCGAVAASICAGANNAMASDDTTISRRRTENMAVEWAIGVRGANVEVCSRPRLDELKTVT